MPSRDRFDIVRESIISIGGMETGHGEQVLKNMVGQIAAAKLLVPPLFQWDINIGDGSTERGGIFSRHGMHVLGPRPGQFIDLADVSGRIRQDGRDYLRHIMSVNRRRSPGAEGQPDRGVPGD
jgi:hypothetical protein